MDELSVLLSKLKIPTNKISSESIQAVLTQAKRHTGSLKQKPEEWNDIVELLWKHLESNLTKYDDQLLCATCFFSVLPLANESDIYLNKILLIINNELDLREKNKEDIRNSSNMSLVVSVMYGLFQSAFLTQRITDCTNVGNILRSSFHLLLALAYEYSRFTYLAFKTINSFKKVLGTSLQSYIFEENSDVKLLNLVNHNWENPITGVRDLNRGIFQMVISNINENLYKDIFTQINGFYWNKAKYLMLSEVIEQCKCNIYELVKQHDWVDGLMYSLHKPGLVSAGADMYFSILKYLKSDNEWCDLFSKGVLEILTSDNSKAIENFTNYWCLTTFKKMPSLADRLIEELYLVDIGENKMYSTLCLLKQANKLGLLQKDWLTSDATFPKEAVLRAVENCNPSIRIQAFDVVCVSHSKSMPQKLEYYVILSYLQDNVNSDCTVLRLSMLNSLNSFLTRLLSTYMINSRSSDMNDKELICFCADLQTFIVESLNLNGNYQRKIATVKLCKLIQDCLGKPPKQYQKQGHSKAPTVSQMLKQKGFWILGEKTFVMKLLSLLNDPSDDIREHVVQLLLSHYCKELNYPSLLNHVIDEAFNSMRCKFFYNISCGRSMFKLITNILLTEETNAKFKSVEDIFLFAYNELVTEYRLKTDIVKSIKNGRQLHSIITILHVVLEVCYQNSYKISCLTDRFGELVVVLEDVSNQFAWEDSSTSSDFSKMSDMVETMIASSGHGQDGIDQTKISGLHQIVLNCLWLNVKVSCDMASLLIQFTEDMEVIDRCLKIITRVLETCRHKGAIEAAGAAIGRAIQYLTSLPEGSPIQQLPYMLLRSKLNDLISEAGAMSSITRRGAGLSIMVHRIVSSDMKRGKPLFHYFMETLLETCNNIDNKPERGESLDNQKDLPQAIYIHFLTRIVTDSSLASDMMYYSAKLASLAFGNLTSPHWQIRNAALQLYGALIPKLIGQKKASGSDEETVATVACDEFQTHSPALWTHITQSLEACSTTTEVTEHSNLVPILNILGNIARRYNFSFDIEAQKSNNASLLNSLILLLHSPLYIIRRLTAKCIFNIFPFEVIYEVVMKQNVKSENFLHGVLILLTLYHKRQCKSYQSYFYKNMTEFDKLKAKFDSIFNNGKHSYLCKQLFEEIFSVNVLNVNDLHETLADVRYNTFSPGVYLWADRRIEKIVTNMPWSEVSNILETLLNHHCDKYGSIILRKLKSAPIPNEIIFKLTDHLLCSSQKYDSAILWEILYEMSLKEKIVNNNVNVLKSQIKEVPYKFRYMIPFTARVTTDKNYLNVLSEIIIGLSDPENNDTDMRHIAALATNEMAQNFERLPHSVRINTIISAVILLQDEDEDIRCLSVNFYKNIKGGDPLNPYICLRKILDIDFLYSVLNTSNDSIKTLCEKLNKILFSNSSHVDDKYNPFANDSKNIYCEVQVIRQMIEKLGY